MVTVGARSGGRTRTGRVEYDEWADSSIGPFQDTCFVYIRLALRGSTVSILPGRCWPWCSWSLPCTTIRRRWTSWGTGAACVPAGGGTTCVPAGAKSTCVPAGGSAATEAGAIQLAGASRPYLSRELTSQRAFNLSPLLAVFPGDERNCFTLLPHAACTACAMGEVRLRVR
jgi:hypothetical protein